MLQGNRDEDGNVKKMGMRSIGASDGDLHMKRSFFPHEFYFQWKYKLCLRWLYWRTQPC